MNEEQVSNASDSTEVPESFISDDASSDFFGNLDKSVNGGILDSEESITSIEAGGNTQAESGVQQENVETLKKAGLCVDLRNETAGAHIPQS